MNGMEVIGREMKEWMFLLRGDRKEKRQENIDICKKGRGRGKTYLKKILVGEEMVEFKVPAH